MVQSGTQEYPAIWLQAATCTGWSVSVLDSVSPTIKNVLIDEVVPGKHVNVRYHATVMAAAGELANEAMEQTWKDYRGKYLLIVEGAIPTRGNGLYGSLGERDGIPVPIAERVEILGRDALAVIALGTCAAFGGIAAAAPNPSRCASVSELFQSQEVATPLVNVPGCPPHPDWYLGTVASVLILGLPAPYQLDEFGRPKGFFSKVIHENCQRRTYYDERKYANPCCVTLQ